MRTRHAALMGFGIILGFAPPLWAQQTTQPEPAMPAKVVFEEKYAQWMVEVDALAATQAGRFSGPGPGYLYLQSQALREVVALGSPVLPYLVDRASKETFERVFFLKMAIAVIAKDWSCYPASGGYADWWRHGHERTAAAFGGLMAQWSQCLRAQDTTLWTTRTFYSKEKNDIREEKALTPAGQVYWGIERLGTAVLPYLVEQMQAGHYEFASMAYRLTDNKPPEPDLLIASSKTRTEKFLTWWEQNKQDWIMPWPDTPAPALPAPQP